MIISDVGRLILTVILLVFVYRETGWATALCFFLLAARCEVLDAKGSVLEPTTAEVLGEIQGQEAAPFTPPEPYRRTLAACDNTNHAVNAWWATVPEELKQDLYPEYTAALKKVGKKK